jgi:2-methylisocitrate lyase-like PEP mutase family enzyme
MAENGGSRLRRRLAQAQALMAPGAYDALSALLVEQAGFEAIYLSGASISYTQLGRPDIGLTSVTQVADVVARVRDRVSVDLIVDADTGFGNALNVGHMMRLFERAGADAVQIEDQTAPKRCGHLAGKSLVPADEMVGKIAAALDARSRDVLVIARTDAIAVEGLESALERAALYREAGADVIFIEAPQAVEQMQRICAAFRDVHLMANMVEGGRTPILTLDQLQEMGFRLAIAPGSMVRAFAFAAQEFLRLLKANGTTAMSRDRMLDFAEINALLGLPDLSALGQRYDARSRDAAE